MTADMEKAKKKRRKKEQALSAESQVKLVQADTPAESAVHLVPADTPAESAVHLVPADTPAESAVHLVPAEGVSETESTVKDVEVPRDKAAADEIVDAVTSLCEAAAKDRKAKLKPVPKVERNHDADPDLPEAALESAPPKSQKPESPTVLNTTMTDVGYAGYQMACFAEIAECALIIAEKRQGKPFLPSWNEFELAVVDFCSKAKTLMEWLWTLRTPVVVMCAIAVAPKLILLWIFIVLAKPISLWAYKNSPDNWKAKIDSYLPQRLKNSAVVRDINEGADQCLPFILFWLYLCCAPFALGWMAVHWLRGVRGPEERAGTDLSGLNARDGFVFSQRPGKADRSHSETNFYSSRAFGLVVFAFFALGIPAFMSYGLYQKLGIEQMIKAEVTAPATSQFYSAPPPRVIPKVGLASPAKAEIRHERVEHRAWGRFERRPALPPTNHGVGVQPLYGGEGTAVWAYKGYWPWLRDLGIEPTHRSVFFVHFYLVSLASALCVLFFRAWFQFPLNFLADEHDLEFTADGIRRKTFKGWFLSVLTINRFAIGAGPDALDWSEVRSLRKLEEGFSKLYPLPETAFKKESLTYKLLNKIAAFIDGLSRRPDSASYLVFSTAEAGSDLRRNIKLNLNDLNREQRARLFYSVKKWAPHVVIQPAAEELLVGSTVLRDNRYTQLWFDMLTSRSKVKRQTVLPVGETLKQGAYTIDDRISSGGQATTYLATNAAGQKCVLKEFILSTSSDANVMIESAREFEAEVSLLSQLNHSGIVRLEDFFFEDGRVYVALEYISGQSLRQKVQEHGPLEEEEVVRIGKSICDVLEYLHSCDPPIVHRDVTPENILIQENGDIKLIDFSLAVRQNGQRTTDSCAKQCYTPPEQFREEACVQSDLYALGATMHYLLIGVNPKPISMSSPKTKAPHVSDKLNSIIERATQIELNQRYESAHWFKLDLQALEETASETADV